jgi:hypothetical protein
MDTIEFPLDDKKLEVLKTLLLENNKELVFWRERNWRVLRDVSGGFIALAGLSLFSERASIVLLVVVIGIAYVARQYLMKNYEVYENLITVRDKIANALLLYETNIFIPSEPLLSKNQTLGEKEADIRGTGSFIKATWIIAIATCLAIFLQLFL